MGRNRRAIIDDDTRYVVCCGKAQPETSPCQALTGRGGLARSRCDKNGAPLLQGNDSRGAGRTTGALGTVDWEQAVAGFQLG